MSFLFSFVSHASNVEEQAGLTIQYPTADAKIYLYKVANAVENSRYELVLPFADYADYLQGLNESEYKLHHMKTTERASLAAALKSYVIVDEIPYSYMGITGEDGQVVFEDLEDGLYLIFGEKIEIEGQIYVSTPVLIHMIDNMIEGEPSVVLDFASKISPMNIKEECTVVKIWKDDEGKENRPSEIVVALYADGKEYQSVKLSEDNNWEHTWKNLEIGPEWIVVEKEVPLGYKVEYEFGAGYISIENEYEGDEPGEEPPGEPEEPGTPGDEEPPEDTIVQTGQLWWPVPVLTALGLAMFSIGWIRRHSEER